MINTISELAANGLWESVNSINTVKPNNPATGDIYYDSTTNRSYVFDNTVWKELKVSGKNALFNRERMRKIKRLFK